VVGSRTCGRSERASELGESEVRLLMLDRGAFYSLSGRLRVDVFLILFNCPGFQSALAIKCLLGCSLLALVSGSATRDLIHREHIAPHSPHSPHYPGGLTAISSNSTSHSPSFEVPFFPPSRPGRVICITSGYSPQIRMNRRMFRYVGSAFSHCRNNPTLCSSVKSGSSVEAV
jgi:hypothetical protein